MDIHKFQECFKHKRSVGLKGDAYKYCLSKAKDIERPQMGEVLKDGIPGHNLYDISENTKVLSMIDNLLE